jgi:hypothetical protein
MYFLYEARDIILFVETRLVRVEDCYQAETVPIFSMDRFRYLVTNAVEFLLRDTSRFVDRKLLASF